MICITMLIRLEIIIKLIYIRFNILNGQDATTLIMIPVIIYRCRDFVYKYSNLFYLHPFDFPLSVIFNSIHVSLLHIQIIKRSQWYCKFLTAHTTHTCKHSHTYTGRASKRRWGQIEVRSTSTKIDESNGIVIASCRPSVMIRPINTTLLAIFMCLFLSIYVISITLTPFPLLSPIALSYFCSFY